MIYQPPAGARDLLPLEVVQKAWINDRIQSLFRAFGYQRIVTSTLEWLDTLTAGGAIAPSTVVQLRDNYDGTLGLRPELTASIARAVVTRMADESQHPQRLCYRANVFRTPPKNHHGGQIEYYQAGVELLFASGVLADAEIILLLARSLQDLGVPNWKLLLGEAGLTRSLLEIFPSEIAQKVRDCLASLDRIGLAQLNLEPKLQERAELLFALRGNPNDVLAKIATLDLEPEAKAIAEKLKALIELVNQTSPIPIDITLDLGLVQTFDYYTGIVFEAVSFSNNQSYRLGQGGRYDRLLQLYDPQGRESPGIGFSFSIEALHSALLSTSQLPQQLPANDWLVIPTSVTAYLAAIKHAQQLRQDQPDAAVELSLSDRSEAEVKGYALSCRISNLAWVKEDGTVTVESL